MSGKFNSMDDVFSNNEKPKNPEDGEFQVPSEGSELLIPEETPLEERDYYKKMLKVREELKNVDNLSDDEFKKKILKRVVTSGLELEAIATSEYIDAPRASELEYISQLRSTIMQAIGEYEKVDTNDKKIKLELEKLKMKARKLELEQRLIEFKINQNPNQLPEGTQDGFVFSGTPTELLDTLQQEDVEDVEDFEKLEKNEIEKNGNQI